MFLVLAEVEPLDVDAIVLRVAHRHWQDPAPARTYGNYQLPGPGHPAGRTMDKDDLED